MGQRAPGKAIFGNLVVQIGQRVRLGAADALAKGREAAGELANYIVGSRSSSRGGRSRLA